MYVVRSIFSRSLLDTLPPRPGLTRLYTSFSAFPSSQAERRGDVLGRGGKVVVHQLEPGSYPLGCSAFRASVTRVVVEKPPRHENRIWPAVCTADRPRPPGGLLLPAISLGLRALGALASRFGEKQKGGGRGGFWAGLRLPLVLANHPLSDRIVVAYGGYPFQAKKRGPTCVGFGGGFGLRPEASADKV